MPTVFSVAERIQRPRDLRQAILAAGKIVAPGLAPDITDVARHPDALFHFIAAF